MIAQEPILRARLIPEFGDWSLKEMDNRLNLCIFVAGLLRSSKQTSPTVNNFQGQET